MSAFDKITRLVKILPNRYHAGALLKHGAAAGVEHSALLAHLSRGGIRTVVDIGANRGQFALVARRNFPSAKIISFEPLKEPAAVFRKVFAADHLVVLYETAVGPREMEAPIHVSRADDSSSLLPISDLQTGLFPGTAEKETRAVTVKPLDRILETKDVLAPALLKIDVQGYEREVLEGCASLLPCFSYVYVECSFLELYTGQALAHDVVDLLSGNGFALEGVYNLTYDKAGLAVQGDFLFQAHPPDVTVRP